MSRISTLSELELGRAEDRQRTLAQRQLARALAADIDERRRRQADASEMARRQAETELNRSRPDIERDYQRDREAIIRGSPIPTADLSGPWAGQRDRINDAVRERQGRLALADASRRSALGLALPESARERIAQWGGTQAQRALGNYRAGLQALGYRPDEIERMTSDYQRATFGMGRRPQGEATAPTGQYAPIATPDLDSDVMARIEALRKAPVGSVGASQLEHALSGERADMALQHLQTQAKTAQAQETIQTAADDTSPIPQDEMAMLRATVNAIASRIQRPYHRAQILNALNGLDRIPRKQAREVLKQIVAAAESVIDAEGAAESRELQSRRLSDQDWQQEQEMRFRTEQAERDFQLKRERQDALMRYRTERLRQSPIEVQIAASIAELEQLNRQYQAAPTPDEQMRIAQEASLVIQQIDRYRTEFPEKYALATSGPVRRAGNELAEALRAAGIQLEGW